MALHTFSSYSLKLFQSPNSCSFEVRSCGFFPLLFISRNSWRCPAKFENTQSSSLPMVGVGRRRDLPQVDLMEDIGIPPIQPLHQIHIRIPLRRQQLKKNSSKKIFLTKFFRRLVRKGDMRNQKGLVGWEKINPTLAVAKITNSRFEQQQHPKSFRDSITILAAGQQRQNGREERGGRRWHRTTTKKESGNRHWNYLNSRRIILRVRSVLARMAKLLPANLKKFFSLVTMWLKIRASWSNG